VLWRVSEATDLRDGTGHMGGFQRDYQPLLNPRAGSYTWRPDRRTRRSVHLLRGPAPSADFAQGPKGAKDVIDHLADVGVIQTKAIPRLEVVNDPEVPHP